MPKITNKFRVENYDSLAAQAETDWIMVHILVTGEAPDYSVRQDAPDGATLVARVYRGDGGHGGLMTLERVVSPKSRDGGAMLLEDFLREHTDHPQAHTSDVLQAYRSLAYKLRDARRAFYAGQPVT